MNTTVAPTAEAVTHLAASKLTLRSALLIYRLAMALSFSSIMLILCLLAFRPEGAATMFISLWLMGIMLCVHVYYTIWGKTHYGYPVYKVISNSDYLEGGSDSGVFSYVDLTAKAGLVKMAQEDTREIRALVQIQTDLQTKEQTVIILGPIDHTYITFDDIKRRHKAAHQ